jgi:hypothetical protein
MRRGIETFEATGLKANDAESDECDQAVFNLRAWLPDAGALEGSGRGLKYVARI